MFDFLALNRDKGFFLSMNSTLHVIPYPINALFVFTTLNSS